MRRTKAEAMQTREAVLQAAAHVIAESGMGGFTIDAVAKEAGVTKGGVLHHFSSKEALLDGLIAQVMEMFERRVAEELDAEPKGKPGRWLRAYIRTIFSVQHEEMNLIPALAAAAAADEGTIERIRKSMAQSQAEAEKDGLDPTTATIMRLAVDGMVFTRAFGIDVLDKKASKRVFETLIGMTESGGFAKT